MGHAESERRIDGTAARGPEVEIIVDGLTIMAFEGESVAAALLRRNPESVVVPFDTQAFDVKIDPSDSILSLADRLAKYGGGGTDCSLPIKKANAAYAKRKFAGVVLVSDNESWFYQGRPYFYGTTGATGVMTEWQQFVQNQVKLQGGDITGPKLRPVQKRDRTLWDARFAGR